ncbi:hypothetical protein [Paenibacillus sinopodophylli]|uniref:hypothetical protein n=1 Tax=Paenibacillus sinopodophylli TaxID=1837342 RepID=UPI00110C938E|nr:hypothetical protein [Paenibacillus sinopodophylli]
MNTSESKIRDLLEKLFQDAGYTVPELLEYIEKLERERDQTALLIRKMKLDSVRKASTEAGMNSRLKEALRE